MGNKKAVKSTPKKEAQKMRTNRNKTEALIKHCQKHPNEHQGKALLKAKQGG